MKKLFFLFLFVSTVAFGQLKCCFNVSATLDSTKHGFHISHITSPVQHIARHDSLYTFVVDTIPYGYNSPNYEIVQHNLAKTVVASGIVAPSGIVTHNFSYLGQDSVNTYDIKLVSRGGQTLATSTTSFNLTSGTFPFTWTVQTGLNLKAGHVIQIASQAGATTNYVEGTITSYTSGTGALIINSQAVKNGSGAHTDWNVIYPDLDQVFYGEVTVKRYRFNEAQADQVIDVSQNYNNSFSNFADKSGWKVFVKGTTPWSTSTASKDLSSITSPQTFTTQTGLSWTAGRLVKISSNAAPNTNYINATVSSYNSGSGALAVTWAGGQLFGSGVHTDWDIELRETWDPYYWYSSNPANPVVIEYYHVTIKSTGIRFKGGESQNVIHDGQISEQYQWGVTLLTGHGANGTECMYFEEADGIHASKNLVFSGFHPDNITHTTGGTGVRFHPSNGTFNATNWTASRIVIHDFLIENANNESLYLGETTDANVPAYFKHQWCLVYRIKTNHSHNEGIQVGSWLDSEIFKITCLDTGLGAAGGQDYNTQYSLGNRRVYWYSVFGTTDHSGFQGFTGLNGSDQEMFACMITCKTIDASTIIKLYHNNTYTNIHYRFQHCTFVTPTQPWFNLYNDVSLGAINANLHVFTNLNAIVTNTATTHANNSGFDDSFSTFNNKQYTSSATPLFVSFSTQDYRPRSSSSPLFGSTTDATDPLVHPYADRDFNGIKFFRSNIAAGAHGGATLMTHGMN